MSIQGISNPSKIISNKTFNWKTNDSGELDVFEAAKYFSDLNEISSFNNNGSTKIMIRDDTYNHQQQWRSGGRMSLDMAAIRDTLPPSSQTLQHFREKQQQQQQKASKEKKSFKQPSSPGGKLASFLNSLFNQTSSKKKKSKSTSESLSVRDNLEDNESPGGMRRKRRSSISHFRIPSINTNASDSKSLYSTKSTGFRTPPPYAFTPTKSYKDLNLQVISLPKVNGNNVEKSKLSNGKVSEKYKNISSRFPEKSRTSWADQYLTEEKEFRKFNQVVINDDDDDDNGGDSDSSSDLFELPNFDLDSSSSGLPVYETTNVNTIKRGVPISSGARIFS